jgi:hypothetical protein
MVDGQPTLPEVLVEFNDWLIAEGLVSPRMHEDGTPGWIFITDGEMDLAKFLTRNAECLGIEVAE